jgi:hypothetical protein
MWFWLLLASMLAEAQARQELDEHFGKTQQLLRDTDRELQRILQERHK